MMYRMTLSQKSKCVNILLNTSKHWMNQEGESCPVYYGEPVQVKNRTENDKHFNLLYCSNLKLSIFVNMGERYTLRSIQLLGDLVLPKGSKCSINGLVIGGLVNIYIDGLSNHVANVNDIGTLEEIRKEKLNKLLHNGE